ncbi:amino acid ABC transporter substrate-binding protein [Ramlibacter sp. WS9]|uniref:amino acid ABC transporter substrate-binding protein n=1 Tax=Ramlibacter sp. WS9 TaxID=1882741 RepID=UPI001141BB10|nr:amino acid ABC transporter substrate-binding protein [Ramlibacter sp. WS9]ROZ75270.1 branched-chain amino acid ABC transporter substrate-binding protein [Ramlibacter sp. WS9]
MLSNTLLKCILSLGLAAATLMPVSAQEPPVRIGYAISRSGPFAAGAQTTQEPNYILWAEQVNAAGGLNVQGKRRKIELVGIDDRSDVETMMRSYEKLMGSDKVDLVLPPWGTGNNFAVMPLLAKHGYPVISPTATGRSLLEMKNQFFFPILQQPDRLMVALADMLAAQGVKTAAAIHVDEMFGLENTRALEEALKAKGIRLLENKSYPIGVKDLAPVLNELKAKNPDAFIGITYPPDTFLVTAQAKQVGFNPKVFYAAVGTSFPAYRDRMTPATVEGVMGIGSWNAKSNAASKAYFDAHVAKFQKEPDSWAGAHAWASLQILQKAIETAGLDRKKIRDYIANTEHDTLIGKVRFKDGENVSTPGMVMQWQRGSFEVVWPKDRATATAVVPKPEWK